MYLNSVAGELRERRTIRQNLQPVQVCHMQTSEQSSFMQKETPCIKSQTSAEAGYTKSTQTCNHPSVSVVMPEIVIENIEHSEESIMLYTGLPDFKTVQAVFEIESLIEHGAERLCTQSVSEMNMYSLRQNACYVC